MKDIIAVGPEEYEKIRIGKELIPIKTFILLVSLLISSIFFFLGVVFKLYLEYTIFAALIFICFMIAVFPYLLYSTLRTSMYQKISEIYPAFLRDLSEALSSGMSITQALKHLSNLNYGPLTPFIKKLYTWISWGMGFDKALERFNLYFKDAPLIKRANGVLIEAYRQGGNIGKILSTVANDLESIKELEKNRRSQVFQQVIVLYIVYFVFAGLMIMLKNVIEPLISTQLFLKSKGVSMFGVSTGTPIDLGYFKIVVTLALIVEAICIGLVMGVAETGKIQTGFKHIIITTLAAFIILFIFVLPEKVNINLMVYPKQAYVGSSVSISGSVTIDAKPATGNISLLITSDNKAYKPFIEVIPLQDGSFSKKVTFSLPGNYTITVKYKYKLKIYKKSEKIIVLG